MTAELTYFTIEADYLAVVADTAANTTHDPDHSTITGQVTFVPLINGGDLILATQTSPRPLGIALVPIVGIIDNDGRLKLRPQSDDGIAEFAPVRLVANSPVLELSKPLHYRVVFSGIKFDGQPASINSFTFEAPNADVVLNLIGLSRKPGQPASGITKIAPGGVRLNDDGKVVFSFGGVDIPEPLDLTVTGAGGGGGVGPAGASGPPGASGPAGASGPPGEKGEPGSEWYFGDGAPDVILGTKPGDVYYDRLNGIIYQLGDSGIK